MALNNTEAASLEIGTPSRGFLERILRVRHSYSTPLEQQRASTLMVTSVVLAVMAIVGAIILGIIDPRSYSLRDTLPPLGIALLIVGVIYGLVQVGYLTLANIIFVLTLAVMPVAENWTTSLSGPAALAFALPVVAASLLFAPPWGYVAVLPALIALAIVLYKDTFLLPTPDITTETAAQVLGSRLTEGAVYLIIVAAVTGQFNLSLQRWAHNAQRRARQLEAAATISDTASAAPTVGSLLNVAVERIRETFGFYHAQVFLVDSEKRMARLEASTGRAGVALLARGHALPVGSRSVVGQTTYSGKPIVVNDVRNNPTHRPNELLPDTLAEMALPLVVGGDVIGALDVQSTKPDAFQSDDINSLQIIANLLANFIEKARLVSQLQLRADEQQRLVEEAQASLRQIEELNRRLTREGWSDYLRSRRVRGTLGYTLDGKLVHEESAWTAPMRQAFQGDQGIVIRQDQQAHIAALPLRVRGEVIGVLEIQREGNRPWTDDDIEMAETLIDRLALAVENARLYEQATLAAEREHVVNKIAASVQEAETVDQILQSALTELSTVLGASRGVVQISPREEDMQAASD